MDAKDEGDEDEEDEDEDEEDEEDEWGEGKKDGIFKEALGLDLTGVSKQVLDTPGR